MNEVCALLIEHYEMTGQIMDIDEFMFKVKPESCHEVVTGIANFNHYLDIKRSAMYERKRS